MIIHLEKDEEEVSKSRFGTGGDGKPIGDNTLPYNRTVALTQRCGSGRFGRKEEAQRVMKPCRKNIQKHSASPCKTDPKQALLIGGGTLGLSCRKKLVRDA